MDASSVERRDVVIAGAGLVGLTLAAALARARLTVALLDRNGTPPAADPDTWDTRVYAISPGSASFLSRVGAWQALSCEQLTAYAALFVLAGALLALHERGFDRAALARLGGALALAALVIFAVARVPLGVHRALGFQRSAEVVQSLSATAADLFTRPVTLALRLFGNMFAGHILIVLFITGGWYMLTSGGILLPAAGAVKLTE